MTPSVAPPRTLDQRMTALERANVIRSYRAALKRDLKAKRVRISDVIMLDAETVVAVDAECEWIRPELLESAKVYDLIRASPKYGKIKTGELLRQCQVSHSKTLIGLSQRQRTELVSRLR